MDARNELLAYLGASIVDDRRLVRLAEWYASYLDVAVVHAQPADTPLNEKVAAIRAQEQQKLSLGQAPDRRGQARARAAAAARASRDRAEAVGRPDADVGLDQPARLQGLRAAQATGCRRRRRAARRRRSRGRTARRPQRRRRSPRRRNPAAAQPAQGGKTP